MAACGPGLGFGGPDDEKTSSGWPLLIFASAGHACSCVGTCEFL